jgi:hypothetical protein
MQLRDVSREVHGQEYNGFYLGLQQIRESLHQILIPQIACKVANTVLIKQHTP